MITLAPQMRIFCFTEATDFRKGINGLTAICRDRFSEDPFSGAMFLFRNRRRTAIKGLVYDGQGFWLLMKRLSEGKFSYWPKEEALHPGQARILSRELSVLFWNGDPSKALMGSDWKKLE